MSRFFARTKRWLSGVLWTGLILAFLLILSAGSIQAFPHHSKSLSAQTDVDEGSAQDLLMHALNRVKKADGYEIQVSLDQTVTPEQSMFAATSTETAHFEIDGKISGPKQARLTITLGRTTLGLAQQEPQELLISGDAVYQREAGRWVRFEGAAPTLGIGNQGILLAAAARNVTFLEPVAGPPGLEALTANYRRIGFTLHPEDVRRQLLAQQGPVSEPARALAELQIPAIGGSGELWVMPSGYPDRLILNLSWVRKGEDPLHIAVKSETAYVGFGRSLPAQLFNPERAPSDGAPLPEWAYLHWLRPALILAVALGLAAFLWLLKQAQSGARRALQGVTVLLILALLVPYTTPVIEAAGVGRQTRGDGKTSPVAQPGSELSTLAADLRTLADARRFSAGQGAGLKAQDDEDGDTLPNGYELTLGTNPFNADTDFDGLTDAQEIKGIPCQGANTIFSDPLNPDSNGDGLRDGDEFWRGQCHKGLTHGFVWDDDNDKDLVPDGLDLSPFSNSMAEGFMGGDYAGANLSFESLDMDPDPAKTVLYPFYVELQVRPTRTDSLRWAYKNLYWPGDTQAAIQNTDPVARFISELKGSPIGSSGKLTLMPFLSATVRESDLPSDPARRLYGVNYAPKKDDNGNLMYEGGKQLYDLSIPLMPIERGGQVYAFQAKMLHDQNGNSDLARTWKNLRLMWAVVGDILMPDNTGKAVPSPTGGYGLTVYDESYYVTGLQVSRQGGTSMMLAAARIQAGVPMDDGPITLLRAGLEAKFLTGELSMAQIKQRFDTPNNATLEQRWGIPQSQEYRIKYDNSMNYKHLDEALATTTITTTKQLLESEFGVFGSGAPTLLFASEQRTSTVNLDDDPAGNFKTITINTCLKPLITSRTLKMQTYQWAVREGDLFGRWESMSLDDTLAKVTQDYAAATPANYPYYNEELNILKLATTSWFIGQTSVTQIGQRTIDTYLNALTDAKLVLQFLTDDGLVPTTFKDVVFEILKVFDAGGPAAWFDKQLTDIMGYWDSAKEFFEASYTNYGPPDAYIKVLPMPGEGSGGQPSEPAPLITEKDFLSYTGTAIKVLGYLAVVIGYFNEAAGAVIQKVADILTKLIEIYKKVRALIDTIKFLADSVGTPVKAVADAIKISSELSALAKPLSLVGLVLTIGFIWATLAVHLSDVGPSIALTLVLRAIVETVILVALFVVAAIFPWGTLVALAIGLIKLIESIVGFTFDPLSLLIDWLFGVTAYERAELVSNAMQIGSLTLEPREPGGGLLSGRTFRLKLPAKIPMATKNDGTKADLEQASAKLHIGRMSDGRLFSLCTPSEDLFNLYKERLNGYIESIHLAAATDCVAFRIPTDFKNSTPGGVINKNAPQKSGNVWKRTIDSLAWVDINPSAKINGRLLVDVSIDVEIPYDECSTAGGCDRYLAKATSAPTIAEFYMDILPSTLTGMWQWSALSNYDPDGDGLFGYEAYSGHWVGPDAKLCPNMPGNSATTWDTDGDGLSDKFEVQTAGFDPCKRDTDGDGLDDNVELMLGTAPDKQDSDADGLTDREETVYSNGFNLVFPWTVQMNNQYPGLPNPRAFPNPRMGNADTDYRSDKQEKAKQSSPHSYNAIPVGEPVNLYIGQSQQQGGVNGLTIGTSAWQNTETAGIEPTLTVTLPVGFSNVTTSAKLQPPIWWINANDGAPVPTGNPNVFRWKLPMLTFNRFANVTITGLPSIPSQPVSITAQLVYTEGTRLQIVTAEAPLWYNAGGPRTEIVGVSGGVILDEGTSAASAQATIFVNADTPVIVQGTADDPERVDKVFVCLVASGPCAANDWKQANGRNSWSYSFAAPADGIYIVRAYGVDTLGAVGAVDEATVGVDTSAPNSLTLDLEGTVYLHTQSVDTRSADAVGEPPFVILSGQVSDKPGAAFISGVDKVGILVNGEQFHTIDVDTPGAASSAFHFKWTAPATFGSSLRNGQGQYEITIAAQDKAGNTGATDSVTVIIDDTPPAVHAALPQVSTSTTISLSGRADDTAFIFDRQPAPTFAKNLTLANGATQFTTSNVGKAVIVGDVNGDAIDDVLLLVPSAGTAALPLQAGIFFGKPGGLPSSLAVANADVKLQGEGPTGSTVDGAAAGDVNGDGVGDLLVGDPGRGAAYLILGRRSGWPATLNLANANWKLTQAGSTGFGGSVASAGDVDGDGLADILVGATSKSSINGPAWLYLGREQGTPNAIRLFYMSRATAGAPRLAGLGDATGDGLSDFAMAAQNVPVALVAGRTPDAWPAGDIDLMTAATMQFSGNGNGQTVAAAGDINGDGLSDLLVGDPNATSPMLYLIHGRRNFAGSLTLATAAAASFLPGTAPNSRLGAGMASLGDVDGDGRADFAFGQPGNGSGPNRAAVIMTKGAILAPNMSVDSSAASLIGGTAASQLVGFYVTAGDVTGDGIVDILVGAPGEGKAYLFKGAFDPGGVAGVKTVEIGFSGPNINNATPVSATLPASWQTATLGNSNGDISAWLGQLTVPGNGDYRLYVRATDKADNRLDSISWYVGNVWVNTAPAAFSGSMAMMNVPTLTNKTDLSLAGAVAGNQTPQMVRIFDGYRWQRMRPTTGNWSLQSTIPLHDLYTDVFRIVARDAVGNKIHALRTLSVDTLVAAPVLSTTMPINIWQTNSPSLTLNWPTVVDASGLASTWALVDTSSDATPMAPAAGNQLVTPLNTAGTFYGHVRVQDSAGNEAITHIGPFLINRAQTPSTILADGVMDAAGGEYPAGTLLNYDPYAAIKPAALWGVWDSSQFYLGFPGHPWGTENKLALYLDTKSGGVSAGLNLFGNTHTLPFAADYALIVGGLPETPITLYRAMGGNWSPIANAQSRAVMGIDTEIVLNRAEIEATGGLGMLAYAENTEGIWAVLPGGARPDTQSMLIGAVVFADKLAWGSLGNGVQPAAGQKQIHAPVISVLPAVQNTLPGGQGTTFQMLIHNPDVGSYVNVPVSVTVDAPMQLTSVSGATCSNCPANGRHWEVLANVAAGGAQTITVNAQMGGADLKGVFPLGVSTRMIGSGLASKPQPPAAAHYLLDQGVAVVDFMANDPIQYRQPGEVAFPILPNLDLTEMGRCFSLVEVNTGGGWNPLCRLGECDIVIANIPAGGNLDWQIRVDGGNGRVSQIEKINVIADHIPPTIEIANTAVLSGTFNFVEGVAWDGFPTTRAPQRVEVSVNGGRFLPVTVSKQRRTMHRSGVETETAIWRLPLSFEGWDGEQIGIVARAIDEADNISTPSTPISITLDSLGPRIAVTQTAQMLAGTVTDGSGVAKVEISLDGGNRYQPMQLLGKTASFDLSTWQGGAFQPLAMIRATDLHGNVSTALAPLTAPSSLQIYLPVVQRGAVSRETEIGAAPSEDETPPVENPLLAPADDPATSGTSYLYLPAVGNGTAPSIEQSMEDPPAEASTEE